MALKTFSIYTLGCKVNQYDSSKVSRDLQALGMNQVENGADLAIINTCTVTHTALSKDKKMLEAARQANPLAKFAVVGCMPVNYREETEKLGVDYIFGAKDLDQFVAEIRLEKSINDVLDCELHAIEYQNDKSRYFLKIQDGCQQFCSYCIIPYNRGKLASRGTAEIVDEVKKVTSGGIAEVVLCGIHLGLYGVDLVDQTNLVALLKMLFEIKDLKKIRLSSIEITEVSDDMIELMRNNRKLARHLHISLQAGCDRILQAMNRPYTTSDFKTRIDKLREAVPEVAITTDVIVGFPGETDDAFRETVDYCQKIGFSKIHVFPFSAHEKTPACNFPEQVNDEIKKQRASELQKISNQLELAYNAKFQGEELEVIIDGRSKGGWYRGKSEYYFDVKFESEIKFAVGQSVKVKNWKLI
ncbi:MAG: tRNA (N(6)-L-threonylcarbamoyladenosine(37)-C(2))-methylthiotransferase MtaB [bacterium]